LRSRLGRPLVAQLLRSEMLEVTLRRGWYHSSDLPRRIADDHQRISHCVNWMEALKELLKDKMDEAEKPLSHCEDIKCSVDILHGAADKIVDFTETENAYGKLHRSGVRGTLIKLEGAGHSL